MEDDENQIETQNEEINENKDINESIFEDNEEKKFELIDEVELTWKKIYPIWGEYYKGVEILKELKEKYFFLLILYHRKINRLQIENNKEIIKKEKEIREKKNNIYDNMAIGLMYLVRKENIKAIKYLKKLKTHPLSNFFLALIYFGMKNFIKSEKYYLKALDIEETFTGAMVNLVILYKFYLNDEKKAKKYIKLAKKMDNYCVYYELGKIKISKKDFIIKTKKIIHLL
jgi:tetratricopeptide (TPR) repeat protein